MTNAEGSGVRALGSSKYVRAWNAAALAVAFLVAFFMLTPTSDARTLFESTDSHDHEMLLHDRIVPGWFDGTRMVPTVYLGTWDQDDFTFDHNQTIHIWAKWNGESVPTLSVNIVGTVGGDAFYGTGTKTTQVSVVPPFQGNYQLWVYSTDQLQEYQIPVTYGETIHRGDEIWAFLSTSGGVFGTPIHWIGAKDAMPFVQICEGACDTLPPTASCTQDCNSNVLFLPGIESSRLYRPDYDGGTDKLWEPLNDGDIYDLFLDTNGKGVRSDVYAKVGDVIDEFPVVGINVYKSFIAKMDDLKSHHLINDWQAVSYDWRLSLDDVLGYGNNIDGRLYYSGDLAATSTPYIIQELRRLAATSKTGKVTIVAHSNGGLVAKRLTEVLGPHASTLIDKMIFVAVPQAGTPEAVAVGLHGQPVAKGLLGSKEAIRTFASTSPMVYNLLTSDQYFTYVDDPIITFDTSLPDWIAKYGSTIHSGERLRNFLADSYGRVDALVGDIDQPIQFRNSLLENAKSMHDNLDNWTPPTGIHLIQIAGWGIPTTVTGINYKKKVGGVIPEPNFTIDGDGTVVVPSALWTSTAAGATNYWFNLEKYNKDNRINTGFGLFPFAHANILEVDPLLNFISDTIRQVDQPLSRYVYLLDNVPSSNKTRLRFALHSPLSLDLYDAQGNHTGVSTTTGQVEEEIPGTYYIEFGDIKYIFSDASTTARVVMDGYADGTFTFNADQFIGDTITASTTFQDIPTTVNTTVTIGTQSGVSTLSPMYVDTNSDGVADIELVPKLDGVVTMADADTSASITAASTTGALGKNGWYISDVIVTLNATDTDSGVRSTYYILDAGATTTGTSISIPAEGIHTLKYYSEDNAGNIETSKILIIKIDKTAPEVVISVDLATKDLMVTGNDNLSSTTISKTATTTVVSDVSGHIVILTFQKTFTGKILTYTRLVNIRYDGGAPIPLLASFLYVWDSKQALISQTVVADNQFLVEVINEQKKSRSTVVVFKKGLPIQKQVISGLALVKLKTTQGSIVYEW